MDRTIKNTQIVSDHENGVCVKVLAEIFQISRSKINQLVEQELILVQGKYLERVTEVISKKRK